MEDRYFHVKGKDQNEWIRIDACPSIAADYSKKNQWKPGIVRNACDEVLTRMNIARFQQIQTKAWMVINVSETGTLKEYILLNKAIQVAVSMLLKNETVDHITTTNHCEDEKSSVSEDQNYIRIYAAEQKLEGRPERENFFHTQRYFVIKMATIAWDFLNISNIF